MKAGLAAVAALLFAGIAQADSSATYDLNAFAGFEANGELIDISYSYQLTIDTNVINDNGVEIIEGSFTTTDLNYIVTDSENNTWTLVPNVIGFGEFQVSDGPLRFDGDLEDCCNGIFIDQELDGPQGRTGQFEGLNWSATLVATPEPSSYLLSGAGLIVLAGVTRNRSGESRRSNA